MKNNKYRYIMTAVLSALVMTVATGCKDDKKEIDEDILKQPFTFSYGSDEENSSSSDSSLNQQDPAGNDDPDTSQDKTEAETVTEYVKVTDADGQSVTEYITVTEPNGEPKTDENGQEETTAVETTTAVVVTKPTEPENVYAPVFETGKSFWFDISEEKDFVFNDEFISVKFRIKDNAPEGVYDIAITNPDFASYAGETIMPDKVVDGKIFVSQSSEAKQDFSSETGFVVFADNAEGNPGDEVTMTFSLKNNPGMCAMIFEFSYDKNALEIIECSAAGEFSEFAEASLI